MLLHTVSGAVWVFYGFGDAAQWDVGDKLNILNIFLSICIGFWCTANSEKKSNNRKYHNLNYFIAAEVKYGRLTVREVWIWTDNEFTEIIYHKGSLTDKELFEINLELIEVYIKKQFFLKIAHVAGTQMIFSAVDELSQGELLLGDSITDMHYQMNFYASPFSWRPYLKGWIAS